MKKPFLALLLILLVVLIGYQVYQNKTKLGGEGDQAKVLNGRPWPEKVDDKKPFKKGNELSFENASSTVELARNGANGNVTHFYINFTVKTTAGLKPLNLPLEAQIDLVDVVHSKTVASTRVKSQDFPTTIAAKKTLPLYFSASVPASSTIPMGTYKAVMKYIYVNSSPKEVKFGTNSVVYLP